LSAPILSVRDLSIRVRTEAGRFRAVRGVSFDLAPGEAMGLVGESGSGKTLTCRALLRLDEGRRVAIDGGTIHLSGEEVTALDRRGLARVRGRMGAMVFQNPTSHLDPVMRVGDQIAEPLRQHMGLSRRAAAERAVDLLAEVGIPDPQARARGYPHEFSGGMRQRVMIAAALACEPQLLIADEPTSALDVTVQAQILRLLKDLQETRGLALLLVTHDLGVVAQTCHKVAVMYAGRLVETGPAGRILAAPRHPYTQGLIASQPEVDGAGGLPRPVPGLPPALADRPPGCAFAPRCTHAMRACLEAEPPAERVGPDHAAACLRWREVAEAV
jgi:peptide/nickel transport system ATP-binding protein